MKLNIGYIYPHELNLYGDNGNVEILAYRAKARGIDVEVFHITPQYSLSTNFMNTLNLIFMGGGPDASQKSVFDDFLNVKGPYIKDYILTGGVGLYICGSYQLLGHYYQPAEGEAIKGLGVFDLYTQHFGNHKKRCIGNTSCQISPRLLDNPLFKAVNIIGNTLVGFENHGGRTYIKDKSLALGKVLKGHGNNSEDGTEGFHFHNSFGSYYHGPILSFNPHFADYLIAEALGYDALDVIDDNIIKVAHLNSLKRNPT